MLYNTVAGGVPSAADVAAAVDAMEALYASCGAPGRLADASFDFMKAELTVADVGRPSSRRSRTRRRRRASPGSTPSPWTSAPAAKHVLAAMQRQAACVLRSVQLRTM